MAAKTGLEEEKYTTSRHWPAGKYPNIDTAHKLSGKLAEFSTVFGKQSNKSELCSGKFKELIEFGE
jgi:hypothetical protein